MPQSPQLATPIPRLLLGGFLIGIAFLVPGTSGAALAATLGFFEPAIAALSNLRREAKAGFRYLVPLAIGGAAGAFLAAVVLSRVLDIAATQAVSLFMGMLAGSLPKLYRQAHDGMPPPRYAALMAAGLGVTFVLFALEQNMPAQAAITITLPIALAAGAIFGAGAVVPGISGSFFLIYLGWYSPLIHEIVRFNIPVIAMTAVGLVAVALVLVKGAHWLFRNRRRATLSVIVGFVTGSLLLVLPADFFGSLWWLNLLLFAAGCAIGVALGRMEKVQ